MHKLFVNYEYYVFNGSEYVTRKGSRIITCYGLSEITNESLNDYFFYLLNKKVTILEILILQ